MDMDKLLCTLMGENDSLIRDYIVPGLESRLLRSVTSSHKWRIFTMRRDQDYQVNIHDHRYGFSAVVLSGHVVNTVWDIAERNVNDSHATHAAVYYDHKERCVGQPYSLITTRPREQAYGAGEWYAMGHDEFHSIRFSRGARVLVIEGPEVKPNNTILLPYSNGRVCDTFMWRPWMMDRAGVP